MAIPKFSELEEKILTDWKDKQIFKKTLAKPAPKGEFVFFEGPPFANGIPHIGHVEARTFKDLILRYKTMSGYHVARKAGWDTQGLPVELEVEKTIGVSGKKDIEKYGVAKFNAAARKSVWKYTAQWEAMTERMAYWLDLEHPYVTYSNDYIETLWWIFKQAWDLKLLEQDFKVVPYCPRCGTALSSHEVAQGYASVTEPSVYLKFELVDEPGTFVLAWTTTPWTLPGNVALAIDRKTKYVKTPKNSDGERFIVAMDLASRVLKDEDRLISGLGKTDVAHQIFTGDVLIGKKYKPLFDFLDLREVGRSVADHPVPTANASGHPSFPAFAGARRGQNGATYTIVPADFVTTEDGTGVVHTAVMYGIEDFELGDKIGLPKIHTVDESGRFNEMVKPWVGWKVKDTDPAVEKKTRDAIIEYLRNAGKLYNVEDTTHDYPFCWRCKSPLLYYAKTSWFIRMSRLRDQLIADNEKINWYPGHIKEGRFGEWLREVKDWAISRERYWGTPLPIWVCDRCQHQECLGSYEELKNMVPTRNRFIFMRHAESEINASRLLNTLPENMNQSSLTATGKKQAAAAASKLKKNKIDAIYSSEFRRAKETAEIIGQKIGLKPLTDSRLNEMNMGVDLEGHNLDELHAVFPTAQRQLRFHKAMPGGETWVQVRARLFSFLNEIDKKYNNKTIVVVSHGDPVAIVDWATRLLTESQLDEKDYPVLAELIDINFPSTLFQENGEFDPHRPFIDEVTWPCQKCGSHPSGRAERGHLPSGRGGTPPGATPSGRGGVMRRVPEVGDTWFDSGSMPYAQWHYPFENKDKIDKGEAFPADYISEAIDQTRGWFYTMLAVGTILKQAKVVKAPPYKNVLVLGLLHDAQGRKLSKSLKNYGDVNELFDKYGADALRWFMCAVNQPWDAKNFDPKTVEEGIRKTFLILMNIVSFWKLHEATNATNSDETTNATNSDETTNATNRYEATNKRAGEHLLDRWIDSLTNQMVADVTRRLDNYDVTGATRAIANFVTDLSTWYVRRSRERFKGPDGQVAAVKLREVLLILSKIMAPFTPFLAETVYREIGGDKESVHLEDWPSGGSVDEQLLKEMDDVRLMVEQGHAIRAEHKLKVRQPLSQAVIAQTLRAGMAEILRNELNVKEIIDDTPLKPPAISAEHKMASVENPLVAIDITVTDELKEEGYLRDLTREFNALRKTAGLQPSDQIIAHIQPQTIAAQVIERYAQRFLKEVRAQAVTPDLTGATTTVTITLADQTVTIGLHRV